MSKVKCILISTGIAIFPALILFMLNPNWTLWDNKFIFSICLAIVSGIIMMIYYIIDIKMGAEHD